MAIFDEPDPAEHFARATAVLGGARPPITDRASKTLYFMIHDDRGCDAWVTPQRFVVRFGGHRSHHIYDSDVAPEAVSWLLQRCGVRDRVARCAGVVPGGAMPNVAGFSSWDHGPRAVWIETVPGRIMIRVRGAAPDTALTAGPGVLEPAMEDITETWPCPHCHTRPAAYRVVHDAQVVCLACLASSPRRPA